MSARNGGGGGVCCDGGSDVVKTLRTIETTIKAGNLLMDVGNKIQDVIARNIDVGKFGEKGFSALGAKLTGVNREALTGTANASGIFSEAAQSVKDAFEPVTKLWDSATGKITGMMSEAEAAAGEFAAET
ncbi:MAG: hypothetical protein GY862_09420, partial [Gammaproteobacteria bacterium]|nr:hypothetical protein [Gammaproteobacteria bacterium]